MSNFKTVAVLLRRFTHWCGKIIKPRQILTSSIILKPFFMANYFKVEANKGLFSKLCGSFGSSVHQFNKLGLFIMLLIF